MCGVWLLLLKLLTAKKGESSKTREQIFLSNSYVPGVKSIIIISMYIMKQ